jgi:hypothetical protein
VEPQPQLSELSVLELRSELKRWEKRRNALLAAFPYLEDGSASLTARYVRGPVWDQYDSANSQIAKLKLELYRRDQAPNAPNPTVELTSREQKIWKVIQRGSSGPQYCRELQNAGINPRKTGVWKDCHAGTYPAAYQLGEPWRHRIQDEKSKIKRKAILADY